ncbi:MAG: MBL fold metallo-hydrolase [Tannerellaceae bacterium]
MHVHQIVNSILSSNTYCLWEESSDEMWLVDCGDAKEVIDFARKINKSVTRVYLTHTHLDHIYGLNELLKAFTEVVVYTNSFGAIALKNSKLNLARYYKGNFIYKGCRVELLDICHSNNAWMVPGHDPSCICYLFNNYLFTGDSFLLDYPVISRFPNGNVEEASQSEQFIKSLWKDEIVLCPGHGKINNIKFIEHIKI